MSFRLCTTLKGSALARCLEESDRGFGALQMGCLLRFELRVVASSCGTIRVF
jgi:hypothetical protein